nr:ABC transporter ATP-binding protein [uncultured Porphyromonas sp.]
MNLPPTIQLHDLSTGYRSRREEKVISRHLELAIAPGEVVMLMGPNGSGKSTLMHTMAGLLTPLSGEVIISGKPLSSLRMKELARLLSLVLTERIPAGNMSISDIVAVGRYPYTGFRGSLRPEDKVVIREALTACHLDGMQERLYSTLSDGEKQRVMIARALAQETPLILLDEPTAHLDLPSRLEVTTMLRTLARSLGKSILISTHELDLALGWADTIWLMDRAGEIVSAAPEDLILDGHIERVFGAPTLSYDRERGEFSIRQSGGKKINLRGEGLRYIWTSRALQRLGYKVTASTGAYPEVELSDEGWMLLLPSGKRSVYPSITTLLQALP